jgi:hypothetical protein
VLNEGSAATDIRVQEGAKPRGRRQGGLVSVAVTLQALGWVSVIWLVTVHVMIKRGRFPSDGMAYRTAGCGAAASVVAAGAAERIWPVAVLGLLWLRLEVFGFRHHVPERRTGTPLAPPMPPLLAGALARSEGSPPDGGKPVTGNQPPPALHLPHVPHPHLGPRTVDVLFKVEMGVVIVIALVLFTIWAQQQRESVGNDANKTLCHWMREC